jgi:hypothetical protein
MKPTLSVVPRVRSSPEDLHEAQLLVSSWRRLLIAATLPTIQSNALPASVLLDELVTDQLAPFISIGDPNPHRVRDSAALAPIVPAHAGPSQHQVAQDDTSEALCLAEIYVRDELAILREICRILLEMCGRLGSIAAQQAAGLDEQHDRMAYLTACSELVETTGKWRDAGKSRRYWGRDLEGGWDSSGMQVIAKQLMVELIKLNLAAVGRTSGRKLNELAAQRVDADEAVELVPECQLGPRLEPARFRPNFLEIKMCNMLNQAQLRQFCAKTLKAKSGKQTVEADVDAFFDRMWKPRIAADWLAGGVTEAGKLLADLFERSPIEMRAAMPTLVQQYEDYSRQILETLDAPINTKKNDPDVAHCSVAFDIAQVLYTLEEKVNERIIAGLRQRLNEELQRSFGRAPEASGADTRSSTHALRFQTGLANALHHISEFDAAAQVLVDSRRGMLQSNLKSEDAQKQINAEIERQFREDQQSIKAAELSKLLEDVRCRCGVVRDGVDAFCKALDVCAIQDARSLLQVCRNIATWSICGV